jgi:hypothetical protein
MSCGFYIGFLERSFILRARITIKIWQEHTPFYTFYWEEIFEPKNMMPSLVISFRIVNFGEKLIKNNVSSIMDWIPNYRRKIRNGNG